MTSVKSFPSNSHVSLATGLAFVSENKYQCCWAKARNGNPTAVSCQVCSPSETWDQSFQFLVFPGMAAKCFIVVSSSLVQDCSGGSGGLSRAVTDNSLGVLGAASAWLFPVLVFSAQRCSCQLHGQLWVKREMGIWATAHALQISKVPYCKSWSKGKCPVYKHAE